MNKSYYLDFENIDCELRSAVEDFANNFLDLIAFGALAVA